MEWHACFWCPYFKTLKTNWQEEKKTLKIDLVSRKKKHYNQRLMKFSAFCLIKQMLWRCSIASLTFFFFFFSLLVVLESCGINRKNNQELENTAQKSETLGHLNIVLLQISNRVSVFSIWGRNINFGSVIFFIIIYAYDKMRRRRESQVKTQPWIDRLLKLRDKMALVNLKVIYSGWYQETQ